MMRTLAPWVLENPIFFHMTNSSSSAVRDVLDQMKEVGDLNGVGRDFRNLCLKVGFEMMIYSFGSGFSLESDDSDYLDKIRDDIAYAHWKGIEVNLSIISS